MSKTGYGMAAWANPHIAIHGVDDVEIERFNGGTFLHLFSRERINAKGETIPETRNTLVLYNGHKIDQIALKDITDASQ